MVHTDADIKSLLGQAIRRRRIEVEKTQEDVAFEAGISTTYLSDVERGKRNVAAVNLVRIAQALGVKASALFEGADL